MKAKEIMRRQVVTINENATLREAVSILTSARVSGLPVLNDKGKLVGIVTEHDIIQAFLPTYEELLAIDGALLDPSLMESRVYKVRDNPVGTIMSKNVVTLDENDTILKAASTIIRKKVRILPIMRGEELVGIVTRLAIVEGVIRGGCRDEECQLSS